MANQLDSIIEELKQNNLTIDEIEKNELTKEELFEVKIGSIIIGPFSVAYLKSYAKEKGLIDYNILVKTMESILWVPLYQHPHFFSTEASGEPGVQTQKKSFYLLVNGRKVGPYRIEDIDYKVKNSEVLFTDLISEDGGGSWKKLYELNGFDLRKHQEEELPTAPGGKVLDESESIKDRGERFDAVGELAQIGHQSAHKKNKIYTSDETSVGKPLWKSLINIAVFVAIIFATIYIFDTIDPFAPRKNVVTKPKTASPATVNKGTPAKTIKKQPATKRRMEEKKERRKRAISKRKKRTRPSKVKEDDPYPEEDNYQDEQADNYYDDKPKPKKKKKARKRAKKKSSDEYYDQEEDYPY